MFNAISEEGLLACEKAAREAKSRLYNPGQKVDKKLAKQLAMPTEDELRRIFVATTDNIVNIKCKNVADAKV